MQFFFSGSSAFNAANTTYCDDRKAHLWLRVRHKEILKRFCTFSHLQTGKRRMIVRLMSIYAINAFEFSTDNCFCFCSNLFYGNVPEWDSLSWWSWVCQRFAAFRSLCKNGKTLPIYVCSSHLLLSFKNCFSSRHFILYINTFASMAIFFASFFCFVWLFHSENVFDRLSYSIQFGQKAAALASNHCKSVFNILSHSLFSKFIVFFFFFWFI